MSNHHDHDVEPYAQAHDVEQPRVHEGILWCNDCEQEFVPDTERPASQH